MRLIRWMWIIMLVVGMAVSHKSAHTQGPALQIGMPAQGDISEDAAIQVWTFEPTRPGFHAFLVNRISGDLDPVITVKDGDDTIGENDDRIEGIVYDAGLTVELDADKTYTIEVGRYSGSGRYQLWVIPAYESVWQSESFSGDTQRWQEGKFAYGGENELILETDPEFSVFVQPAGSIPLSNFYLQAAFEWRSSRQDENATTGLMFHVDDDGTRRPPGYYFLIKPNGTWSFLLRHFGEFQVLQEDTPAEVLNSDQITLGVWVNNSVYRLYANGELLGEVTDNAFNEGLWGLHIRGANEPARVAVDNLLLTVQQSDIPDFPDRLENWASVQPDDIIAELADILPAGGERRYFLESQTYDVGPVQNRVFLQNTPESAYSNVVASADIYFINGDNLGCGYSLRYLDTANQLMTYVDMDGGAGLVYTEDGHMHINTYNMRPETENSLQNDRVRIMTIALDDIVAVYVNGQLFTVNYVPPITGSVTLSLLNYSTSAGACGYENFWVWR